MGTQWYLVNQIEEEIQEINLFLKLEAGCFTVGDTKTRHY